MLGREQRAQVPLRLGVVALRGAHVAQHVAGQAAVRVGPDDLAAKRQHAVLRQLLHEAGQALAGSPLAEGEILDGREGR